MEGQIRRKLPTTPDYLHESCTLPTEVHRVLQRQGMSVQVGVGILVRNVETREVLLGKRTVKHGDQTYSFPGGHLEFGESFQECAARELLEETNLTFMGLPREIAILNNVFQEHGKHYVTILVEGVVRDVKALRNMEPEKCESWEWVTEEQIRGWIDTGERSMFAPIISYYSSKT